MAIGSSYPFSDCAYWPGLGPSSGDQLFFCAFSGYTSMSFTTKSLSVPEVDANSAAASGPVITMSCSSVAISKVSTSDRPSTNRWSATSHVRQSPAGYVGEIGRCRYGTGFAGSETYSSYSFAPSPAPGAVNDSVPSACKYRFVACTSLGGQTA